MKAIINGNKKEFSQDTLTITEILLIENIENPEMVSVQKNGEFVDKSNFDSTTIESGDEVDFLFFMGGGQK